MQTFAISLVSHSVSSRRKWLAFCCELILSHTTTHTHTPTPTHTHTHTHTPLLGCFFFVLFFNCLRTFIPLRAALLFALLKAFTQPIEQGARRRLHFLNAISTHHLLKTSCVRKLIIFLRLMCIVGVRRNHRLSG